MTVTQRTTGALLAIVCAALGLGGCGSAEPEGAATDPPPPAATVAPAEATTATVGIAWHQGDVESAFARAAAEDRPIFLYWGAAWCPPCHQIKATVFSKREFIERSRLFVPVYLDGDTDDAQRVGERFGVLGYPTMIVFAPNGDEITRIPGGINIELYASVLDLALADVRPVRQVLDVALGAAQQLDDDDCRLLAFYAWGQDPQVLADTDPVAAFAAMAASCPDTLPAERSRLYMAYLNAALTAAGSADDPRPFSARDRAEALRQVESMLGDPGGIATNTRTVIFDGADLVNALTEPASPERDALQARWLAALDAIAADQSYSTMERLYTSAGKIRFARIDDPEAGIPNTLRESITAHVAWADAATTDPHERQAVINAAFNTLAEAGMDDLANELLTAELGRSQQPYYFMLSLAELAERAGRTDEAIAWLERAYAEAEGPATRFQWGYNYLVGLLNMAPDDVARIQTETIRVFGELEGNTESAFYQRTKLRLERLHQRFLDWSDEAPQREVVVENIRRHVIGVCASIRADDASRETCEQFLAT